MNMVRTVAGLALLGVAGCDVGVAPVPAGLEFDVEVTPEEMYVGDTATVALTYWNPGDEPVTVEAVKAGGCGVGFELQGPAGHVGTPQTYPVKSPHACILVPTDITLEPGEERRWTWDFTGYERLDRDTSDGSASDDKAPLPPGTYQVYGVIHTTAEVLRAWDSPGEIQIRPRSE